MGRAKGSTGKYNGVTLPVLVKMLKSIATDDTVAGAVRIGAADRLAHIIKAYEVPLEAPRKAPNPDGIGLPGVTPKGKQEEVTSADIDKMLTSIQSKSQGGDDGIIENSNAANG